jgi:hypothetical protein
MNVRAKWTYKIEKDAFDKCVESTPNSEAARDLSSSLFYQLNDLNEICGRRIGGVEV